MNINDSIYNVQSNNQYSRYSYAAKAADTKAAESNDSSKKTDSLVYSDDSGAVSKTYTANGTLEGVKNRESTEFSYDDETRQKAEAIIDEWQEQIAEIKEGKSAQEQEDQNEQEKGAGDQSGSSGKVSINSGKLARMLAAAKTRSQVQAVIAKIQSDLNECEAGKNNGMDVDEASVKAAEQLLQQARSIMGSAENREATPGEEMAAALAALM